MRALVLALAMLPLTSCGGDEIERAECGRRTLQLAGEAPACSVGIDCKDDEYRLVCDPDTDTCVCLLNDVEEQTVPYEDAFCPTSFDQADIDAHVAAASDACAWP